jgi:hypothetical protein
MKMKKNPGRKERRKQNRSMAIASRYTASLGENHKNRLERAMGKAGEVSLWGRKIIPEKKAG